MKKKAALAFASFLLIFAVLCPAFYAAEYDSDGFEVLEDAPEYQEVDVSFSDEYSQVTQSIEGTYVHARVVEIVEEVHQDIDMGGYGLANDYQTVKLKALEGTYKGQIITATYDITDAWGGGNAPKPLDVGDTVIAQFTMGGDGIVTGMIMQYKRSTALILLSVIFLVALVFFGGKRGLRSIVALVVTCLGLIFVMVPAMTKGMNPVFAAVLGSIFSISVTLIILYGFTVKTLSASLGATGGVIAAGIITAIMNSSMKMTGLVDEEAMYLAQSVREGRIDLRGILLAAIIISVLGGTMDVGISISSALDELKANAPDITGAEMLKSGVNIGIDIMGASLNTLILSYVGGSIHLLMLFNTYDYSPMMILNDEMIASELLQALTGSMGLLLTVPITSLVAALLMCRGNFGTLTPDCFVAVAVFNKLRAKLFEKISESKEKAAKKAEAEEAIPESLYAAVQKHMENIQDIDSDYFGGLDDDDSDVFVSERKSGLRK